MGISTKKGFNVQASIYVDPARLDDFFEMLRLMRDKIEQEPECVFFEAYQAQDDPGHIRLVENWTESPEWFMTVRIKRPWVQEYFALVDPMLTGPRDFKFYNRLDGYQRVKEEAN